MLQKFDLSYFVSKSYFDDDGSQYFLIFQQFFNIFEILVVLLITLSDGNLKSCYLLL